MIPNKLFMRGLMKAIKATCSDDKVTAEPELFASYRCPLDLRLYEIRQYDPRYFELHVNGVESSRVYSKRLITAIEHLATQIRLKYHSELSSIKRIEDEVFSMLA